MLFVKKYLKPNPERALKALSLMEILVVLIIIGILVLLALPNLLPVITRAKTTEITE